MSLTLAQIRKREKKEQNLNILYDICNTCESQLIEKKIMYNTAVDRYKQWRLENNFDGQMPFNKIP